MVEIESARCVNSIFLKFWLTLEYRRECNRIKQCWFRPDRCSLSFQRGSCPRCWYLEARNHQNLSSKGFHIRYKFKIVLVHSITDPYPLTCGHHCHGILHGQQFYPIGRVNYLAYNAKLLPNDPGCQTEKRDHISIQNVENRG